MTEHTRNTQTTTIIRNIKSLLQYRMELKKNKEHVESEYDLISDSYKYNSGLFKYRYSFTDDLYFTFIHILYLRLRESTKQHTEDDDAYIQKYAHNFSIFTRKLSETLEVSEDSLCQEQAQVGGSNV